MKKINLISNYYVQTLTAHNRTKDILLDSINNFVSNNSLENISNTDWNIPSNIQRQWFDIFINENMQEILEAYKQIFYGINDDAKIELKNWWFQQYENESSHGWHCHPECSFSNVYYLELPEDSNTTEFFSDSGNFFAEAKEGDLVIFPGYIPHRAINNSDKRRTVLVFNSIFRLS